MYRLSQRDTRFGGYIRDVQVPVQSESGNHGFPGRLFAEGGTFVTEQDRTSFNIDINRLMMVMSEIYSEMYGCKVTFTAVPKEVKP